MKRVRLKTRSNLLAIGAFMILCLFFVPYFFRSEKRHSTRLPGKYFPNIVRGNRTIVKTVNRETILIFQSDVCELNLPSSPVEVVILITSYAGNHAIRRQIRRALPSSELLRLKMRRVFLLGQIHPTIFSAKNALESNNPENRELIAEQGRFGDLVMGDFLESYRNLTYKHLMGLSWAVQFCSEAKYIVKQDDDIAVDYYQLSSFLQMTDLTSQGLGSNGYFPKFLQTMKELPAGDGDFIVGKPLVNMPVIRDKNSKWFVSQSEKAENVYPDFVSGWGYISTPGAIEKIIKMANQNPYFWIDDAHITGMMREASNIRIIDFSEVFTHYLGHLICCFDTKTVTKKNNTPFWCDFMVAPTNGHMSMLTVFHDHARFCHTTQTCVRRFPKESLNRTCVITDSTLQSIFTLDSSAKTLPPKGISYYRPVRLSG